MNPDTTAPLFPLVALLVALLACNLPRGGPAGKGSEPAATGAAAEHAPPDLSTVAGIRAQTDRIDAAVGKGEVRTAETHNETGMGSMVVGHQVDGKLVKIVRRTELAPPTISTAFYYVDDALVLADTRITDTIDGQPLPPPDRRYYRNGQLLQREGQPASDTEPDAKRATEDLTVARELFRGMTERSPEIRLPEGVW